METPQEKAAIDALMSAKAALASAAELARLAGASSLVHSAIEDARQATWGALDLMAGR